MKTNAVQVQEDWNRIGVRGVAQYCLTYMPESYHKAEDEFVRIVDPYVVHSLVSRGQDSIITQMIFDEWLVFDYIASKGKTPLEHYCDYLITQDKHCLALEIWEVIKTQFFSDFWVLSQVPEHAEALIEDAFVHKTYRLNDSMVASNARWTEGLLSLRIAQVDGHWISVGAVPMHDNGPCRSECKVDTTRLLSIHPEGKTIGKQDRGLDFIVFAEQFLGASGGYLPSAEIHSLLC